jgi:hypothetical protein
MRHISNAPGPLGVVAPGTPSTATRGLDSRDGQRDRLAALTYVKAICSSTENVAPRRRRGMKHLCEFMSEGSAAAAAMLWFVSASIRLKKPNRIRHGLESGLDDPRAVLIMVYKQSRWSAWAAIAAGLAAVFAIADGLLPGT